MFANRAERLQQERTCGGCRVCCLVMAIEELDKYAYAHCAHECEAGCAIYGQHPPSCQEYHCIWRMGEDAADDWRPDKSGIMLDRYDMSVQPNTFIIYEVRKGALIEKQTDCGDHIAIEVNKQAWQHILYVFDAGNQLFGYHAMHLFAVANAKPIPKNQQVKAEEVELTIGGRPIVSPVPVLLAFGDHQQP